MIDSPKVLVIPDIHQCLSFAEEALSESFDTVVFLGDYFDCYEQPDGKVYYSIEDTCHWLNRTKEILGHRGIWLLGNHDLSYLESSLAMNHTKGGHPKLNYTCSGYSNNKATAIKKYLHPNFLPELKLSASVDGYILSHAGFHPDTLPYNPSLSVEELIQLLSDRWSDESRTFRHYLDHWVGRASWSRGGRSMTGSPIWLDWDEFVPIKGVNQIVGHTNSLVSPKFIAGTDEEGVVNSLNFCIDVYRTAFGVIHDGNFTMKNAKTKKIIEKYESRSSHSR
jgi:hypothetical protein